MVEKFEKGGLTRINEQGGEIINLPDGSKITPDDIAEKIARDVPNSGVVKINIDNSLLFDKVKEKIKTIDKD